VRGIGSAARARVVPHEEPGLSIEYPASQAALDFVVGELHQGIDEKPREPRPLPVDVPRGLSERTLRLGFAAYRRHPHAELLDDRDARRLPPREALLERLAEPERLGVDVKQPGKQVETGHRSAVAAAKRFDQPAPRVGVAAATLATGALDAVVGRGAVAHDAGERAAAKKIVDVPRPPLSARRRSTRTGGPPR